MPPNLSNLGTTNMTIDTRQSLINSAKELTWLEDSKAETMIPFFEYSNAFSTRFFFFLQE